MSGCTGDKESEPSPSPSPADARARLAELAQATANATFDATYSFGERASGKRGTMRWRQGPPRYRLDIEITRTAAFFALPTRYVSCSKKVKGSGWSCFLVARKGEVIPELFDPGIQRLFHDAVADLAANPEDYQVTAIPAPSPTPTVSATSSGTPSASPSPSGLPAEECFHVDRLSSPSPTPGANAREGFETGDYCFAEQGVPTRFDVATGLLILTKIGPKPNLKSFTPPAKVVTLPKLSPSPKPKKK